MDIPFEDDGTLSVVLLEAFADGYDATVKVWYDQSGGSNHAEQSTLASQPKIVDAGTVIYENGLPALEFDGSNSYMAADDVATTQPTTVSLVLAIDVASRYFFDGAGEPDRQAAFITSGTYNAYAGATKSSGVTALAGDHIHEFILFDNLDGQIYVNNVGASSLPMLDYVLSGLTIGQRYNDTNRLDGRFQELIFWNADHSGDRTTIQTNVNDFYSIYP
jgi:hypothetical protein